MTTKSKAEALLLAMTFVWGGTFAVVKIGMRDISPILLIAIRFIIAAGLYGALFWRSIFPIRSPLIVKGSILGLFLFLGFVAQNIGLLYTTASKSGFITGMMVVFVPLLQYIIERRAPKLGNLLGVAIVSTGLWFLTSPTGASFNIGDALTIVCSILFAVYIVYLDVISREMTPLQLTFLQMSSTAVYSTCAVLFVETPRWEPTTSLLISMLYLTLFATVLTTYVQTRYQKETTPTRAVIIFALEPVIASIVAYVALSEEMGILGIVGGALIVGGVLLSEFSDTLPFLNRSFDNSES